MDSVSWVQQDPLATLRMYQVPQALLEPPVLQGRVLRGLQATREPLGKTATMAQEVPQDRGGHKAALDLQAVQGLFIFPTRPVPQDTQELQVQLLQVRPASQEEQDRLGLLLQVQQAWQEPPGPSIGTSLLSRISPTTGGF